ncbi:MAG: N-acetylmuramoyl-L-alanine amidase [Bacteroides sp.]|nr:N-acetylmuramoyl-L-alanine amidase [Bacteroides sp.]MCM1378711.1 N-acetylmuramoyl-L-alanine amidase [Bacteroides sp.]MCM1444984.1 N-acetylmuramoyl-L-alanine amidase [Prevotella sp.]
MNILLKAFLITISFLLPVSILAADHDETHTIVLDPGHGGKDYGAVGAITNEKTINLNVALEVRRLLKDNKDFKIVMTRDDDRFIPLQERANIANKNHGDLFISIHVNSVAKSNKNRLNIAGASVYTLGLHRTASNLEVAKRENSVMELEQDYTTKYQGFDPNSAESYIMFELSQNKHLDQSIKFADKTVLQLVNNAGRRNRGVLQAGFWVLHASAMPSVLIELDFICNPTSEKFMHSKEGVSKMARSIANAILQYFGHNSQVEEVMAPAPDPCPEVTEPAMPAPVVEQTKQPVKATEEVTSPEAPKQAAETKETDENKDKITYRIQILAAGKKIAPNSAEFKGLTDIQEYTQGGMYKYTVGGDFSTEAEALKYLSRNVKGAFPQAFIIKWQNGKRIN